MLGAALGATTGPQEARGGMRHRFPCHLRSKPWSCAMWQRKPLPKPTRTAALTARICPRSSPQSRSKTHRMPSGSHAGRGYVQDGTWPLVKGFRSSNGPLQQHLGSLPAATLLAEGLMSPNSLRRPWLNMNWNLLGGHQSYGLQKTSLPVHWHTCLNSDLPAGEVYLYLFLVARRHL